MKIWNGYGSEHSMNLVMIGHFKELRSAEQAREIIDQISTQAIEESSQDSESVTLGDFRFSNEMTEIFNRANIYTIRPIELEQFIYDVRVDVEGNDVVVRTDETEISAFLKVLIEKGAKVEIYSAHYRSEGDDDGERENEEEG